MGDESCCDRGLTPSTQSSPADNIVSAAKAHAANIRRTLWLKEYKRANCRAFVDTRYTSREDRSKGTAPIAADKRAKNWAGFVDTATSHGAAREGRKSKHALGYGESLAIIDGPIYTPSYWREWQRRSKTRRGFGSSSSSSGRGGGNIAGRVVSGAM